MKRERKKWKGRLYERTKENTLGVVETVHECVCVLLRSIQKLEELNVGMENLGEEVKSLAQQCNGNGNTPAAEDNNNPPSVSPEQSRTRGGGVLSSTPQHTTGGRAVPPPSESPVVSQRYCMISLVCAPEGVAGLNCDDHCVLCFFDSGQKHKADQQDDSPGSLSRSKEVGTHTNLLTQQN